MFRIGLDNSEKNLLIETDDPGVKGLLEYVYDDFSYSPFHKKYMTTKKKIKIYNRMKYDKKLQNFYFEIGIGWISYVIMLFKSYMYQEDYNDIVKGVYLDTYRVTPFKELRDIQNSDVLFFLKYKRALISVYTGYGKSYVIAVLANYFAAEQKKRVLLITPQTKPRDELLKRIKKLYGIDVPIKMGKENQIAAIITSGFLNKKELKDPTLEKGIIADLESYDVVLVDEVEYTINPAGIYIYDHIKSKILYGFSGTADKKSGEMINLSNGLTNKTVRDNTTLIKYFGPSTIYRQPLDKIVNRIRITTRSMNSGNLRLWEIKEDGNIYLEMITKIFTNPDVCNTLVRIVKKYPLIFIPINNLQNIIYHWIDNYFKGVFRVLLVCFEGYLYYDLSGNMTKLDLQGACDIIEKGEVDIIPSTASGFRALDLPGLQNILLIDGIQAGSVLQQVGRIARMDVMNILSMEPGDGKKIPIYTKSGVERDSLIENYYKYCKINNITISELDLLK